MCNILTSVDWWVKWKIGSWSLQIWLKNTLVRDSMRKLLLLFNEFFLYLDALNQNLIFLEETYTFLYLLTQLSSLSYVCFVCRDIFYFTTAFLFCLFYFPVFVYFVATFFCFASVFLFCCDFFVLPCFFSFPVTFLFCCGFFILP